MGRAVGTSVRRRDGDAKVTDGAKYIDDLTFPGMLFGATMCSTIPRREIVNTHIDFSLDLIMSDYRDIPGKNYVALLDPDQPCLAEREAQAAVRREIAPIDDLRSTVADRLRVAENLLAEFWRDTE